jgi:hypothetical protein
MELQHIIQVVVVVAVLDTHQLLEHLELAEVVVVVQEILHLIMDILDQQTLEAVAVAVVEQVVERIMVDLAVVE